jgi:excinuclease ABC subunit A
MNSLTNNGTGRILYILDGPTTGLHFADIEQLLKVLQKLVDNGNTVVIIEHNMDIIKTADHIIDLRPDGGDGGGFLLAEGTPEKITKSKNSYRGKPH